MTGSNLKYLTTNNAKSKVIFQYAKQISSQFKMIKQCNITNNPMSMDQNVKIL